MGKIRELLAMPYVPLALVATLLWFSGSTYWYVCKTEELCSRDNAVAVRAEADEPANELDAAIADTQKTRDEALVPGQEPGAALDAAIADTQDSRDEALEEAVNEPDDDVQTDEDPDASVFNKDQRITALFTPDGAAFATIGWQDEMTDMIDYLRDNPEQQAEVLGYAARAVSPTNEQELSSDRAEALKAHMVSRGVSGEQITIVVKAYEDPVADNLTEEGRAQNRRAVVGVK